MCIHLHTMYTKMFTEVSYYTNIWNLEGNLSKNHEYHPWATRKWKISCFNFFQAHTQTKIWVSYILFIVLFNLILTRILHCITGIEYRMDSQCWKRRSWMKDRRFHPVAPLLLADSTLQRSSSSSPSSVLFLLFFLLFLLLYKGNLQRLRLFVADEYQKLWRGASKTAGNFGSNSAQCVCAALE